MQPIYGRLESTSCCGLKEFRGLSTADPSPFTYGANRFTEIKVRGTGYIATTIGYQRSEAKRLKANGFKKVATWRNANTGNTITLWFYGPRKPKRKKRAK